MRYPSAHAATSGSVPFALRDHKPTRMVISTVVAAAIGLTPALMISSPAAATAGSTGGLTISSPAVTEGGDLVFTLKCASAGDTCATATYALSTPSGTAASGSDFQAVAGNASVTFTTTSLTKSFTIKTIDDGVYEGTETVTLDALDAGHVDDLTSTGTIYDKQTIPSYTLTASPATVTESGSAKSTITATLSGKAAQPTEITLNTADGTATAGDDYTQVTGGSLIVAANSLTNSVDVYIDDDGVKDTADLETFTVNGVADFASPKNQSATVTIKDAQSTPKVTLTGDAAGAEGDALTYTLHTTVASELPISVKWNAVAVTLPTGDSAATPGDDFTYPSDRTVTIPAGSMTTTFVIPLTPDMLNENYEDFGVEISDPKNAVLGTDVKVTSKITDTDTLLLPVVSIDPTSVTEGNSGKAAKTFTATISPKSGRDVTVNWSATTGSAMDHNAMAGRDFSYKTGKLTFPAGATTATFTVDVIGDTVNEGDETFDINLWNTDGASDVSNSPISITIKDDDAVPTATFDNVSVKEGDAGWAVTLPIKLSNASSEEIHYDVTNVTGLNNGTADLGVPQNPGDGDFQLLTAVATIPAGQTSGYVVVLVNGDMVYESDETAFLKADVQSGDAALVASSAATKTAKLTLENDDKAPSLEVDSITGKEGATVALTGTVKGVSQSDTTVNVMFKGYPMNKMAGADEKDFTNPGITPVKIDAGTDPGTTLPITNVVLTQDTSPEPAETILVNGTGVGNVGTVIDGVITIEANDGSGPAQPGAPTISAPAQVTGAATVKITGKTLPETKVELWGAPFGAELKYISMGTSDKAGNYSFDRWIGQGYQFATQANKLNSPTVKVWVVQAPVFVVTTTKSVVTLKVQGNPRGVGQSIIVQRWVNGAWTNAWRGTTGAGNQWAATVKMTSGTALALRAFVAGYTPTGIYGGYSDVKRFTVK